MAKGSRKLKSSVVMKPSVLCLITKLGVRVKWLILTLVGLSILIVMPPIVHGYIYPSWGGDSAEHLIYFHNMDTSSPLYYGQYVIGKVLNALPVDINVSFLWFNYIAFIMMIWAVGISTSLAVNHLAGILASILASFGCLQTVGLFVGGTIFDLIGIGLLLPIVLLCLHNRKRGIGWKFASFITLVAFAFCHTNGKYIFVLIPIVVVYEEVRERVSKISGGVLKDIWDNGYLMYMIGLIMVLLVGFAIGIAKTNSVRLFTDAMVLLMIAIGGILALVPFPKRRVVQYALIALAVGVSIPNLLLWFQNNNVVKSADKQAFTYLNGLQDATVSAVVSQDIYQLFVEQQFVTIENASYVVVRSIPMAFRKGYSEDSLNLVNNLETNGYRLVREFDCGEKEYLTGEHITVDVYGRN